MQWGVFKVTCRCRGNRIELRSSDSWRVLITGYRQKNTSSNGGALVTKVPSQVTGKIMGIRQKSRFRNQGASWLRPQLQLLMIATLGAETADGAARRVGQ